MSAPPRELPISPPRLRTHGRAGAESLRAIASYLNDQGIPTARGGEWSGVQVARVIGRQLGAVH